jgi:Type IV secretion-system coupling protein DNA-binding domain
MLFTLIRIEESADTVNASPATKFTTFRVDVPLRDRLKALKKELGFTTYNALFNYTVLEITKGGAIPPADYDKVFKDNRPVIITGESGSGKTTTVKQMLERWEGSALIFDVTGEKFNEYSDYQKLDLGAFFALKWDKGIHRVRFIPNSNVQISQAEAATIFSHLNFIKNSGTLKDWVLVIEEGHRFGQDANMRALLIEARKFVRKLILITTDWRTYEGIAKVYKPLPRAPFED